MKELEKKALENELLEVTGGSLPPIVPDEKYVMADNPIKSDDGIEGGIIYNKERPKLFDE